MFKLFKVFGFAVILFIAGLFILGNPAQLRAMVPQKAVCVLYPTAGNNVHGIVTFTKVKNGIEVMADVEGLTPGEHGFHVHQFGDCSADDGTATGGHFNPDNTPHGAPTAMAGKRHVGDFGNITAGKDGKAHFDWVDPLISFEGEHNIIGRAIIVHDGKDDLTSQPSGAAGPRVAQGVIGISK